MQSCLAGLLDVLALMRLPASLSEDVLYEALILEKRLALTEVFHKGFATQVDEPL